MFEIQKLICLCCEPYHSTLTIDTSITTAPSCGVELQKPLSG